MKCIFFESGTKSAADQSCKTGLWGSLAIVGVCCVTPFLLGLVGLAFLRPFVDSYVLLRMMVFFLLLGLYGWIRSIGVINMPQMGRNAESYCVLPFRRC
jgi:hypothetical protein